MQLFIFRRLSSSNSLKFAVPANDQEMAGILFQSYFDKRTDLPGSGEPWRNHFFLEIAGKVGDQVFVLN